MNESLERKISRRSLLKGAVAGMGIGVALAFTGRAVAAKATKAAMKYQDKPNGEKKCSKCTFFIAGKTATANGTCQIVEGSISPQGYCIAYSPKS